MRILDKNYKQISKTAKIVVIAIIILVLTLVSRNIIIKITYPQKYNEYVEKYAKEYHI